jgi:hypothetical protein
MEGGWIANKIELFKLKCQLEMILQIGVLVAFPDGMNQNYDRHHGVPLCSIIWQRRGLVFFQARFLPASCCSGARQTGRGGVVHDPPGGTDSAAGVAGVGRCANEGARIAARCHVGRYFRFQGA